MNLTSHFQKAIAELAEWRMTHGEEPYGTVFYNRVDSFLREAAAMSDSSQLYEHVRSLNWIICDAGPIAPDFIPTFKEIFLGLYNLKRKNTEPGAAANAPRR